jgi:hypothetical protein
MKHIKKLTMASYSEALTALRKLHKRYVRACGSRFRSVPFCAIAVPGWIYVPKTDTVMLQRQVVQRQVVQRQVVRSQVVQQRQVVQRQVVQRQVVQRQVVRSQVVQQRQAVQRQAVQRQAVQRQAVQRQAVQRQVVQRQAVQRQVVHRKVRPTTRRTLRALGGRRVTIEGFGKRSPALFVIAGNGEAPAGAWLSPVELRRFIEAAIRILK